MVQDMVRRVQGLVKQKRPQDAFALLRYFYRIGDPIVEDAAYDAYERLFRKSFPNSPYCTRSYDDDPIPFQVLEEFGIDPILPDTREKLVHHKLNN